MSIVEVMRALHECGVPAGKIGEALDVIARGGSAREAMDVIEPQGAPVVVPATFLAEFLLAEAARMKEVVEVASDAGRGSEDR